MNTNPFVPQPPLLQGQSPPQTTQPDHPAFCTVAQHPQWSRLQAPPPPACDPQRMIPPSLVPPLSEQNVFYTNYDYGSQWHGQQNQYQQHQHPVSLPVTQPLPHLVTQLNHHSYHPATGNPCHHVPQPPVSPQPQLAYYPHLQSQRQRQQQRWYHTLLQRLMRVSAVRQQSDNRNLNRQPQHHAPLSPQLQFEQPQPLVAQNTGVYSGQYQEPGRGDGRGTRGGSMSGIDPGGKGRRVDQFVCGVRAHWSGGNFGEAASTQAEGRNTIPASPEWHAAVTVPTQLHGAHGFNISGNPWFANIGMNTGNLTTVNNYGGTHGLGNLKEFVSFAALHGSSEQDPERRCHPGTRKAVLGQLRDWFNKPNPTDRIFWLHGPAGAGKSAIAQTIADEYKKRGVAATFFFYRSDPSRNDGNRLFPTIAWQLAFSIPATKDFIIHVLNETPHLPTQAVEAQFEQLVAHPFQSIHNIVSQMSQPAPVVIIDGIDECFDEKLQQRFLTVIGNAVKEQRIPLRFIIVSRPEALIEEALNKFKDFAVSIDLAELDDSNYDIQKYLEDKFSEIAFNQGLNPTWPGQEIIEEIVFKSSGNFIFASVVIRFIRDEDYNPQSQLDIVRKLKPPGTMSPFALLDELYLEILKRPRDQDFLRTFLTLLVGRTSIEQDNLHKDDAMLMNISEKDLHTKLRRVCSLLNFKPFIVVYHKSFLDFLQDPSRSGQYHVSKEGGLNRYLKLIVNSIVQHISMAIEQPNRHERCLFSPGFKFIVHKYPPKIVLPVKDWRDALKPLLDLQDKLLNTSNPKPCRVTQVMRDLLLHLVFLQGKSHPITAAQAPELNMNKIVAVTEAQKNIHDMDLDSCVSILLSCLQKTDSVMVVDRAIIDRMFSFLVSDYAESVAWTASDAEKLIDLIDLLTNNGTFLSQCGRDAACKAARLASKVFAKVPHLPQSLFLNKPGRYIRDPISELFELECQSAFISRMLDHNYIVPVLGIYDGSDRLRFSSGNENEQNEPLHEWLKRSRPNLVTRIRAILEVARTIRYIHSMDVAMDSDCIESNRFFLNSNLRAKFEFIGLFAWWVTEALIYGHESTFLIGCTFESNISAFADLFHKVCFDGHNEKHSNRLAKDAKKLIKQCHTKNRPTMKDVVKEMETWNLT